MSNTKRKLISAFKNSCLLVSLILFLDCQPKDEIRSYDVIVLGSGTGAVSAALQSARNGSNTLYVNPLPWYGGMLTASGVSATDGNHNLHAGIWAEWRSLIRTHYGGPDSVFTGWVSNTMFEPHVGHHFWEQLLKSENKLTVLKEHQWSNIDKISKGWSIKLNGDQVKYECKILVDGTDLGDVAASLNVGFDIGMDARSQTNEEIAPVQANDIIQDMTYVAILKDFGEDADKTIDRPANYNPDEYACCCQHDCNDPTVHPCDKMLSYGLLPNSKYLINWPINGNDYNVNVIANTQAERNLEYEKAKQQTLGYIYYLQTELGYKNLGLADDEFPTDDKLALMPYHREGRRVHGLIRFNLNHITKPFNYDLYKTGIAVGDYPVDHHNYKSTNPPKIEFPQIPSFNIPIGSLIPKDVDNLILADKSISVTNIVNGCTRLQPAILLIGQAAGMMASMAAQKNSNPKDLNVREVQMALIKAKSYVMPYQDVAPGDLYFESIQKIGATGILKGEGIPHKWANKTLFYPDSIVVIPDLLSNLAEFDSRLDSLNLSGNLLTKNELQSLLEQLSNYLAVPIEDFDNKEFDNLISRKELAMILDTYFDPFISMPIDIKGNFMPK